MKNKTKLFVLLAFAMFTFVNVNAQFLKNMVKLDITSFDPAGIPSNKLSPILDTTKVIFTKYVKLGSLLDEKGKPNPKVLAKFRKLFSTNTKVVNDLLKRPGDLINYNDYLEDLETFIDLKGIKFDIKDAKIESITQDDNYYRISIRFKKSMYQGFDKKGNVRFYKKPFDYDLTLKILMSKATMEDPKIYRIEGHNLLKQIPKKESFAGVFAKYGLMNLSYNQSDFLSNNSANIGNYLTGRSRLSFGLDYMRNLKGGQNLYFNIGIQMNILNTLMKSDSNNIFYNQNMNIDDVVDYNRTIEVNKGSEEKTTINLISVPIGLSYRIDKGQFHTIFVGLNIAPAFYSKITHVFNGDFNRSMKIGNIKIVNEFKNDKSNQCNGPQQMNGFSYTSKTKGYNISGILSLKYLYRYSYNQSIAILLDYGMDLTPVLPNADKIFLGENDTPDDKYNQNTSFSQSVYKDIKSKYFNIGIGWYYNFQSDGLLF